MISTHEGLTKPSGLQSSSFSFGNERKLFENSVLRISIWESISSSTEINSVSSLNWSLSPHRFRLIGGDLKTFLRENRGTPQRCCVLNMGDLIVFALDIARGCEYLSENKWVTRQNFWSRNLFKSRRAILLENCLNLGISNRELSISISDWNSKSFL